jgi:hypothetical protein
MPLRKSGSGAKEVMKAVCPGKPKHLVLSLSYSIIRLFVFISEERYFDPLTEIRTCPRGLVSRHLDGAFGPDVTSTNVVI